MTFFNDFLYRKDNKRFERNIRSLLKECRDYIIPDDEISIDRDIQKSIKRLKDTIAANDHIAVAGKPTQRKAATQPDASASKISNKNSLQEEENVNKEAQRNSVSANTLAAKPHTKSSKQTHYETAYDDQDW